MQLNIMFVVTCITFFLAFNYAFPLSRYPNRMFPSSFTNQSLHCPSSLSPIADRTKKMASNIGNVIRKFKDNTQEFMTLRFPSLTSNRISEEDLRHYEKLVVMKKNPYIDLNQYELRNSPQLSKNPRQSNADSGFLVNDPSLNDPIDVTLNVEIINRGLSGFAFPPPISPRTSTVGNMLYINTSPGNEKTEKINVLTKKSADLNILHSLKDDVALFSQTKN